MISNYFLLCLFWISASFVGTTVAREAIIDGFSFGGNLFPYQVSVHIHGRGHVCGGGIIEDRFILTAAHCILNRDRQLLKPHVSVLVGTVNLNKTGPPAVTAKVQKVFFPREFHATVEFKLGDIAVLKLKDSLQLEHRKNLKKLLLPRGPHANGIAMIAGFGWNEYRLINNTPVGHTNGRLQYVETRLLSDDECEKQYPYRALYSDRQLCATAHQFLAPFFDIGACIGDGGGPLVQNYSIIGILSRISPDCNEKHFPAIYTRVAHYLSMIFNVMEHDHHPHMISLNTQFDS